MYLEPYRPVSFLYHPNMFLLPHIVGNEKYMYPLQSVFPPGEEFLLNLMFICCEYTPDTPWNNCQEFVDSTETTFYEYACQIGTETLDSLDMPLNMLDHLYNELYGGTLLEVFDSICKEFARWKLANFGTTAVTFAPIDHPSIEDYKLDYGTASKKLPYRSAHESNHYFLRAARMFDLQQSKHDYFHIAGYPGT
jgi:hypothetical protein